MALIRLGFWSRPVSVANGCWVWVVCVMGRVLHLLTDGEEAASCAETDAWFTEKDKPGRLPLGLATEFRC